MYIFSRFIVRANKDKYRTVDGNYMIEFSYYTTIEEKQEIPLSFPLYACNLVPFENISNYVGETRSFLGTLLPIHLPILLELISHAN